MQIISPHKTRTIMLFGTFDLNVHNDSITLSFLIVGHTKLSPAAGFGLVKKEFRKTKVDCLADIVTVVDISSKLNKAQLVGLENGPSEVPVFQWDAFFFPVL